MSHLVPFEFEAQQVRVVLDVAQSPWFVAKDVANVLQYRWDGMGTIEHVPPEWRGFGTVPTPGGSQEMALLSEHGLYFFLGRSDKPKALPFQKWLAGEMLPSLRRTGFYAMPGADKAFRTPRTLQDALRFAADLLDTIDTQRQQLAVAQAELARARAAAEGGPPVPTVPPRNPDLRAYSRQGHLPWTAPIKSWLDAHPECVEVTSTELLTQVIGMPLERVTTDVTTRVGHVMSRLGWTRARRRRSGTPTWVYVRPGAGAC